MTSESQTNENDHQMWTKVINETDNNEVYTRRSMISKCLNDFLVDANEKPNEIPKSVRSS